MVSFLVCLNDLNHMKYNYEKNAFSSYLLNRNFVCCSHDLATQAAYLTEYVIGDGATIRFVATPSLTDGRIFFLGF